MKWAFRIGTIAGIRIEVHVTFVLFVAWAAFQRGLLARDPVHAVVETVFLLLIFACVLLHELGHALTARRYGIRTRDIILLPIGGVARLERMPDQPWQEIVVALAGPAVNLVIAAALWWVSSLLQRPLDETSLRGGGLLSGLFWVNVIMLTFNLIPAFPMDGGRVLRAALALRLPYVQATRIAAAIGQGIALLFGVVGFFYNPILMFVALFVFLAAGEEDALVRTRASLSGLPARAAMLTEYDTLQARDSLQRAVDLLMAGSQQDFPVVEDGRPIGVLNRGQLLLALQRSGASTPVGEIIEREPTVADAGEPLEDVLQRMRERQRTALPVVSGGHLVGLLTLENITELLLVQNALRGRTGRA